MTAWLVRHRPAFFHFTCSHGRAGIGLVGRIRPNDNPEAIALAPWAAAVWLTNAEGVGLPDGVREVALGLTSHTLGCDRVEYCYRVERAPKAVPWLESPLRTAEAGSALEAAGTRPDLWWVSPVPVRGVLAYRFGRGAA